MAAACGFVSVINAWYCDIAGYCVDQHDCSNGCGPLKDRSDITTFTCDRDQYCSTVISSNDFGESFYQVGCGNVATKETIYANPPPTSVTTTTSTPSSSSTIETTSTSTISSTSSTSSDLPSTSPWPSPSTTPPPTTSSTIPANETMSSLAADSQADTSSSSSTPLGPIIGGAVGGLTVVCITVLAIFFIRHRNRRASSGHSTSPLRRSSSCNKHDTGEEPSEAYELGAQRQQFYEASELNRDPAELPGV